MKLTEFEAKTLLAERGVPIPPGQLVTSVAAAEAAASAAGTPVAVKAQVHAGGRGKAGGVVMARSPAEAADAATHLLGSTLVGETVTELLIEEAVELASEHYVAVAVDPSRGRPVIMRSDRGGMEVESMADTIERTVVAPAPRVESDDALVATLVDTFTELDALLVEVNPLGITTDGRRIALDAKIEIDDAARFRHRALFERFDRSEREGTERERAAAALGLRLIELGGDIAVLANGAGLTMATMDAVVHAGGRPANFLEIGGDAYTKATPALELVLSQPGVRSLLVNFCGAFARCDVMTAGVLDAWEALGPEVPIEVSISGTGQDEAHAMVRQRLGVDPHPTMAAAVAAAVAAAAAGRA